MSNPGLDTSGLDTPASHAVTPSADGVRRLWTAIPGWLGFPVVAAVLALAPVAGLSDFAQSLIIEVMIYAMLASSLNLLLGQTGLVSLCHAAFFAVGAYAAALCANALSTDVIATLACAVAAGLALALPVGWLSVRLSGFYFLMITFSFAQMVFVAAMRWTWLSGGSDGLIVTPPTLFDMPVLQARESVYGFVLVGCTASLFLLWALYRSSFGQVLIGIRDNTRRMRALGYNVRAYKLVAFLIAAGFSAFAGGIYVCFSHFISPDTASWTQSATALVMVLVGGAGTTIGPVVGATVILLLQNWSSSYTDHWNMVLGLLFIVVIWISPDGIVGVARRLSMRLRRNRHADS
jgi:branched-chain amino acid transport system permease protein